MVDAQDKTKKAHWEEVWSRRTPNTVSWYQAESEPSSSLIQRYGSRTDAIVDVGCGAARLANSLLAAGFMKLSVLDISRAALAMLARELAPTPGAVEMLEADVLEYPFGLGQFGLWHDRAVFHFLLSERERARYRTQMSRAVRLGGHAIIQVFAPEGPERCSGLPVCRYDAQALATAMGAGWQAVESLRHEHLSPGGALHVFTVLVLRRVAAAGGQQPAD